MKKPRLAPEPDSERRRDGVVVAVTVIVENQVEADALAAYLSEPECRGLQELTIQVPSGGFSISGIPARIRRLSILDRRRNRYDQEHLGKVLESIGWRGLNELVELDISLGWCTDPSVVEALSPVLAGSCPALERLRFAAEGTDITRLFLMSLLAGPILPRLAKVSLGTIGEDGARLILDASTRFVHLEGLELSQVVGQHGELDRFRLTRAFPQYPSLGQGLARPTLREGQFEAPPQALKDWVSIPACGACGSEAVDIVSRGKAEESPFFNNERVDIDWEVHCRTCRRRTLWAGSL